MVDRSIKSQNRGIPGHPGYYYHESRIGPHFLNQFRQNCHWAKGIAIEVVPRYDKVSAKPFSLGLEIHTWESCNFKMWQTCLSLDSAKFDISAEKLPEAEPWF